MSQITFLGREDREGLARLMTRRPVLLYDEEVGGWDTLYTNDGSQPEFRRLQLHTEDEPTFDRVFAAPLDELEALPSPWTEAKPSVCYQIRWGEDQ